MSLPILVAIVAIGIALTVAAVHFTGGSKRATIADAWHARQVFLTDFPDERVGKVTVTADRASAFLGLDSGRTGIVQSFGDSFFTRIVGAADVASVEFQDPATILLRFRDFTWPGGVFRFADRQMALSVAVALEPSLAERKA